MIEKIKVYIDGRNNFDKRMIRKAFEVVSRAGEAEYFICQDTINVDVDTAKIILIIVEPPLTGYRINLYNNLDLFHTVLTYVPNPDKENQFPITEDADVFPCNPAVDYDNRRKDTTITNRKIYYAGQKNDFFAGIKDMHNSINLYHTRHQIVGELLKKYEDKFVLFGAGWPTMAPGYNKVSDWRRDKIKQIDEFQCDFVLCLDNIMMKNHIYEKIHDGFSSDRVALYLGEPNIDEHIPKECYVDLRPFFNVETHEVDVDKMLEIVKNMTQEEYDKILEAVHKYRDKIETGHTEECTKKTQLIIDRIRGDK